MGGSGNWSGSDGVLAGKNSVGMGLAGLEPAAYCLGGSRSIHLSYKPCQNYEAYFSSENTS